MSGPSTSHQRTLNNFVGLGPDPPRQRRVDTLFRKQAISSIAATVAEMGRDDDGAPRKKRRVIESDESEDDKPKASTSNSKHEDAMEVDEPKGQSPAKPKPKSPVKPQVASIFAKKPAKPAASTSKGKDAKGKGKAAAVESDEDEDGPSASVVRKGSAEPEEDEEDSDEAESSEEETAAVKMAEIFTKKQIGSSKPGAGGKTVEWEDGQPVPYAALAQLFTRVEGTSKRLEILRFVTEFFVSVIERTPKDLLKVTYLCINRICPDYEGLELGIGEGLLMKAISESTGRNAAQLKADYKKVGDLGMVAQNSRNKQPTMFKPKPLTVPSVFADLKNIAGIKGKDSQSRKIGVIKKLIAACQGEETRFIIRSLEGKLRIGLAEPSVLVALGHAAATTEYHQSGKKRSADTVAKMLAEAADTIKSVFSELPNYDQVIPALLENGVAKLHESCKMTPGIPLKPMLAKPTKAITEVLNRFQDRQFTCEFKYDGERAQVHRLDDGKLRVFSRNSEDMSIKYPDLVDQMAHPGTTSFVLDAEAVAWDKEEERILPFQELSRRKRKDVKAEDVTVKVHIFAFDLLYLNGESLLQRSFKERRELLHAHFKPVVGEFAFATSRDADTDEAIQVFLDESVKASCEGLMVKMLEGEGSTYEPSKRSMNWLKVKKDYLAGVGDSFDLVVIGGYHGRGKRTAVYGAFLLACYDPDSETYQSICKIGTGFSEEMLEAHYASLHPLECSKKGYFDLGTAQPDVFFEPKYVWEVLAADLSQSPVYSAARSLLPGGRGVSLRFPRFIRIRDDKEPDDATDAEQVMEAYNRQASAAGGGGKKGKKATAESFYD